MLAFPTDAQRRENMEGWSTTPIHLACQNRAPVELIGLLIDANPEALVQQDRQGRTPLHLTILNGGDEQTILLILRRGGKIAASLQSPRVGSPLHVACMFNTSPSIFEALVQANIDMATTPSGEKGFKPAELVLNRFFLRFKRNYTIVDADVDVNDNRKEIKRNHPALRDLVARITILLSATRAGKCRDNVRRHCGELNIHDLIANLSLLGNISPFLDIAVRLNPDQVSKTDNQGNFPLHLVVRNPSTSPPCAPIYRPRKFFVSRDPIEVLATYFPIAASIPDQCGDLPLHVALKSGERKWGDGLSSLVKAFPFALQRQDRGTGLFPFQLPVVFLVGSELDSLDTIFELLIACPIVVALGC
jgi:hypothetical protein